MVNPFEIPSPFDEPLRRDQPSTLQAEPIWEPEQPSEPPAEPQADPEPEAVEEPPVDYVTAQEAASLLGMNLNHLRQLTFQKKLTVARREGRRSLYSLTAINEYKEKHNAKP